MDINPTFKYKNAEIELVVEDDVITTSRITMDGECVNVADITDENGNEQTYEADGIKNEPYEVLACDYGKTLTLVSVAYDDNDNWGPVIREKLFFTHDGDSPISEFNPVSSAYRISSKPEWK